MKNTLTVLITFFEIPFDKLKPACTKQYQTSSGRKKMDTEFSHLFILRFQTNYKHSKC